MSKTGLANHDGMESFVIERSSIREGFQRIEEAGKCDYVLSEGIGQGYARLISSVNRVHITDFEMTFHRKLEIESVSNAAYVDLFFCLGEGAEWDIMGKTNERFDFETDESFLLSNAKGKERCTIEPGKKYRFMGVKLHPVTFQTILKNIFKEDDYARNGGLREIFGKYPMTPAVKVILQQIRNCRYDKSLRNVYMEGKLLELMATYVGEAVLQNGITNGSVNLSRQDMIGIRKAKEILDHNLAASVSLSELSKLVCLNEYKLKKGFKEMFGQSVHAYVIDQRLEKARLLFEEQGLSVSDAAFQVGYGNLSFFTLSFRKKFGVNPGDYLRHVVKYSMN
ncbi:AraC family transcriptional regulator [Paenibacillus ehimensis]|uniref:helix-turn-helix domain-containing protein n=1 Tax=Paenibacillus ehimensis TaxID=79264 RepID=UPI003D2B2DE9